VKQNINLFQPVARRDGGTFNSKNIFLIWAATLLIATAYQVWLAQRNTATINKTQRVQLDLVGAEERLNAMTASRVAGGDSELEARLNEALRELDLRETILGLVSGNTAGDIDGFSDQLRSLARQEASGVWLTRVRVTSPGSRTTLEGRALSPEAVPLYLRQLSEETALAGQRFDIFEIQRPEEEGEAIRFSMNRRDDADVVRLVKE